MSQEVVVRGGAGGVGFSGLLTIVFIILKLVGVIQWSWLWVLCPIWIGFGIFLVVVVGIGVVALIVYLIDR
jgi:hypothetical protein